MSRRHGSSSKLSNWKTLMDSKSTQWASVKYCAPKRKRGLTVNCPKSNIGWTGKKKTFCTFSKINCSENSPLFTPFCEIKTVFWQKKLPTKKEEHSKFEEKKNENSCSSGERGVERKGITKRKLGEEKCGKLSSSQFYKFQSKSMTRVQ